MGALAGFLLFMAALAAFLEFLNWRDRLRARALALQVDIKTAIGRQLNWESSVAVDVIPAAPWRPGRVFLSGPRDGLLIEAVSASLLRKVPEGYELVVRAS